jgi:hypothetical protein
MGLLSHTVVFFWMASLIPNGVSALSTLVYTREPGFVILDLAESMLFGVDLAPDLLTTNVNEKKGTGSRPSISI